MRETDEPAGGDPPCWAHLFEEEPAGAGDAALHGGADPTDVAGAAMIETPVVDLTVVAQAAGSRGPAWTRRS